MKQKCDEPTGEWGLLANGSSGSWDVAVNESLDGDEWFLEIDGPQTYLIFQLSDGKVIAQAVRFLESSSQPNTTLEQSSEENALTLGRFGSASVSLLRD